MKTVKRLLVNARCEYTPYPDFYPNTFKFWQYIPSVDLALECALNRAQEIVNDSGMKMEISVNDICILKLQEVEEDENCREVSCKNIPLENI